MNRKKLLYTGVDKTHWKKFFATRYDMLVYNVIKAWKDFGELLAQVGHHRTLEVCNFISLAKWISIANGSSYSNVASCGYCFKFFGSCRRLGSCCAYERFYPPADIRLCNIVSPEAMIERLQNPDLLAYIRKEVKDARNRDRRRREANS